MIEDDPVSDASAVRSEANCALTVAFVTSTAVFAFGMTSTLVGDQARTTEMMVGEIEDVTVHARDGADMTALLNRVRATEGVTKAFSSTVEGIYVSGASTLVMVTDDPSAWRYNPVFSGRLPRHDNEIVLGARLADVLHVKVNDTYTFDKGAGPAEFLVTGIATGGRGMGQYMILTTGGYQRLSPAFTQRSFAIYTSGDRSAVIDRLKADPDVEHVTDTQQGVAAELSSYLFLVPGLSFSVVGLTSGVVVLVVSLMCRRCWFKLGTTSGSRRQSATPTASCHARPGGRTSRPRRSAPCWGSWPGPWRHQHSSARCCVGSGS